MREEYRRKVTTTTRTTSSYGASGNRTALGYWIPLALTVTAATVALGAWLWSERSEDEESSESETEHYYASGAQHGRRDDANVAAAAGAAGLGAAAGYAGMSGGPPPGPGPMGSQSGPPLGGSMPGPPAQGGFIGGPAPPGPPGRGEAETYYRGASQQDQTFSTGVTTQSSHQDQTFIGRMSNALGMTRSTSPGRTGFGSGGWATAATGALAAAGEMVEKAVHQVRGSSDDAHSSDQEKWAEEADKPERTHSTLSTAAAGAAAAAAVGGGVGARTMSPKQVGITRQGTAQEFYSGAVDVPRRSSIQARKRKTVAVVVSSFDRPDDSITVDAHFSMLAELPEHLRSEQTQIIVLIYAPNLHTHPLSSISRRASERATERRASASVHSTSSSYQHIHTPGSNLGTEPVNTPLQTPGDFPDGAANNTSDDQGILAHVDPKPMDSNTSLVRQDSQAVDDAPHNPLDDETTPLFKSLYNQASALVDRDTSILPYTSFNGHKHILKSIQPEIVYIQESLCGQSGEVVAELQGWVRQVVVVIGDEGGIGGLIDSDAEIETEDERRNGTHERNKPLTIEGDKWWKREEVTGVGRGVSVVEGLRVGEDWERRVNEEE